MIFLFFLTGKYLASLPKVKEDNSRINFVFLGVSGEDYKPPDLADTIIFFSYNKINGRSLLLSLPRDIWLDFLKAKINTAYHYGGPSLVKEAVGQMAGQPIHYVFILDFSGFKKIVDWLGGINFYVERSFDDFRYPIPGKENDECGGDPEFKCRYEHLHFDEGWENLDGETALKYIRSRNAEGEEGTDFARSQRQQKFLLALKDKILSPGVYLNPKKILGLVIMVPSLVRTNLRTEEYFNLVLGFLRFDSSGVKLLALNGAGGVKLLYHPQKHYSGQWVLVPAGETWQKVQGFIVRNLP